MVFITITKEDPRRGLQSQPLPTPKANGPCLTIRVPAPNVGLVPGGEKRPVVVVLGPKGARLDLRLSGPGCDGSGWFTGLSARGVQGLTTTRSTGRPWRRRVWTGSSAPCTCSAPWDGTPGVSTTT